jgi:hypothetical protein
VQSAVWESPEETRTLGQEGPGFRVGWIVRVTPEGKALVDFLGNAQGAVEARSLLGAVAPGAAGVALEGRPVLLVFEEGDPSWPIILGIVGDRLVPEAPVVEAPPPVPRPRDGVIDGKRIVFDAKEEIVLRCGKSSITLRKDGKVVVLGAELVSRASGTNKIKGSAVKIN